MTVSIQSFVYDSHTAISNISSRFSIDFEAFASKSIENLEEMLLWDNMHNCAICRERV